MAMAFSPSTITSHKSSSPSLLRLPNRSSPPNSVSFRFSSTPNICHRSSLSVRSSSSASVAPPSPGGVAPAVSLTETALKHLNRMRSDRGQDLCLRIGVKQGGCSGMSYTMDFESRDNARADDSIIEYDGFVIACEFYCGNLNAAEVFGELFQARALKDERSGSWNQENASRSLY